VVALNRERRSGRREVLMSSKGSGQCGHSEWILSADALSGTGCLENGNTENEQSHSQNPCFCRQETTSSL
jgi:hypothetical protein